LNKYFKADIHFRGIKRQTGKPSFGILSGANKQRSKDYND